MRALPALSGSAGVSCTEGYTTTALQKPRRVSPPERRKKVKSFSQATCAAEKIPLGLQTLSSKKLVVIGLCYAVSLLGLSTIISKIYGYDGYYALIVVVLPAFIWGIPKIKKLSAEKKAELSE